MKFKLVEDRQSSEYIELSKNTNINGKLRADLRGKIINSPMDLAEICKIFRDNKVERFHIIYMDGNKIIGSEGVTANQLATTPNIHNIHNTISYPKYMPNEEEWVEDENGNGKYVWVPSKDKFKDDIFNKEFFTINNRWVDKGFKDDIKYSKYSEKQMIDMYYNSKMKRLNADGYYIEHNHPTDNINASSGDIYIDKLFKKCVPGYKGSIILGITKASYIGVNDEDYIELSLDNITAPEFTEITKENSENFCKNLDINKSAILYINLDAKIFKIELLNNKEFNDKNIFNYIQNQKSKFGAWRAEVYTKQESIFNIIGHSKHPHQAVYGVRLLDENGKCIKFQECYNDSYLDYQKTVRRKHG